MIDDWKDKLSQLRGSLDEPEEANDLVVSIEEIKPEFAQREPLTVITDRKGRNGKTATIIEGFQIQKEEVENIARKLKQKLGVGGSVREGEILIQGDYKTLVTDLLKSMKFKVK